MVGQKGISLHKTFSIILISGHAMQVVCIILSILISKLSSHFSVHTLVWAESRMLGSGSISSGYIFLGMLYWNFGMLYWNCTLACSFLVAVVLCPRSHNACFCNSQYTTRLQFNNYPWNHDYTFSAWTGAIFTCVEVNAFNTDQSWHWKHAKEVKSSRNESRKWSITNNAHDIAS